MTTATAMAQMAASSCIKAVELDEEDDVAVTESVCCGCLKSHIEAGKKTNDSQEVDISELRAQSSDIQASSLTPSTPSTEISMLIVI